MSPAIWVAAFGDLARFNADLLNRADAALSDDCGLNFAGYQAMRLISTSQACRVFDVAVHVGVTPGAGSKLIDRLEARGWCARQSNPADGRSSLVALTDVGQRALPGLTELVESVLTVALREAHANPSTSARTVRALARFQDALGA